MNLFKKTLKKLTKLLSVFCILAFLILGAKLTSSVQAKALRLEPVSGAELSLNLKVESEDLKPDLSKGSPRVKISFRPLNLLNKSGNFRSISFKAYEIIDAQRVEISEISPTIGNPKKTYISSFPLTHFNSSNREIFVDVLNSEKKLVSTYKLNLEAKNLDAQISSSEEELADSVCDNSVFGKCQMEYILDSLSFETYPKKRPSTEVMKSDSGAYKVRIGVPLIKDALVEKSNVFNRIENFYSSSNGDGSITEFPDSLVLNPKTLSNPVISGEIEFDGDKLYYSSNGSRKQIAHTGQLASGTGDTIINNFNLTQIESAGLGEILYTDTNGTILTLLPGSNGQVLSMNGTTGLPQWQTSAISGSTVTDLTLENSIINNSSLENTTLNGNNLNILGAGNGNLFFSNVSGNLQLLNPSSDGKVLKLLNGLPAWQDDLFGAGAGDILAANNLSDLDNGRLAAANLGLTIGSDVQAYDAELQEIADMTFTSNGFLFYNGNSLEESSVTSFARTLLESENGTQMQTILGIPTASEIVTLAGNQILGNKTLESSSINGGTLGDLIYTNALGEMQLLHNGSTGQVLSMNGTTGLPEWKDGAVSGSPSLALGEDVEATANNSFAIGHGNSPTDKLINNTEDSLIVGFNSNAVNCP
jgi:hypothetical protein